MGQNLNPERIIGVDVTKPGEVLRRDGSFGLPPAGTLIEAADVTVDGGANNTPSLLFRAKYDSDGTTTILSTKKDIGIRNSILSSGAYQLDFLNDAGSIIGSLTSGGEFYAGANKAWHAGNLSPTDYLLKTGGVVTGNITFDNTANSGILTGDNTQRLLIGGGSSWAMASGAYINLEGIDHGGLGAGGNIHMTPTSGKEVYINSNKVWHAGNLNPSQYLRNDIADQSVKAHLKVIGSGTGAANIASVQFYDTDGTTRKGWVGEGSSGTTNMYVGADGTSDIIMWERGGNVQGRVHHAGNLPNLIDTASGYSFVEDADLNNLKSGFAYANTAAVNKPANGHVITARIAGGYSLQLWAANSGGSFQWRNQNANTWSSWNTIWHSGNDGAGSGLDADLLDGLSSTQFLRSDTSAGNDALRITAVGGHGIRFWNGSTNYSMQMSEVANTTYGGELDAATDYNMYFTMAQGGTASTVRGFVFKSANNNTSAHTHITPNGVWAKDFTSTSDVRLKENFRPIEGALDKVNAIETFYHTWKGELNDGKEHLGVSAQQINTVVPQVVKEGNRMHVSYSKLVPLLIAANQELSKRLEAVERRLNGTK